MEKKVVAMNALKAFHTSGFGKVFRRSLNRILCSVLVVLATMALLGGRVSAQPLPDTVIFYKTIDTVRLKLHVFYPRNHSASDNRGSIVLFYGGGWNSMTQNQFFPQCDSLAALGMVCITGDYRVKNIHGTEPPECVRDGNSAIRWVRQNARALGINPNKIAAGGGSAGGHVAAATSLLNGYDELTENGSISSDPNALVLFNPVYDNGPGGYGHDRVLAYWQSFSPMHNIDNSAVPTITFLGTSDALVPVSTAQRYDSLMEAQGVRSELFLYPGAIHGFFNNQPWYGQTLGESISFLQSLGYFSWAVPALRRSHAKTPPKRRIPVYRGQVGIAVDNGGGSPGDPRVTNIKGRAF